MKKFLFLLLVSPLFVLAQDQAVTLPIETMALVNETEGEQRVVSSGDRIRLFKHSGIKVNGDFISLSVNGITIERGGKQTTHTLESISAIRVFNGVLLRILGGYLAVTGVIGYVYAGITAAVGIIGLATGSIAAIVLVAAPVLGLYGLLFNSVGNRIKGKKYKMKKGWVVR